MQLNILAFGISKDIIGANKMTVDLTDITTVADFRAWLQQKYPKLAGLKSLLIAVNEEYGQEDLLLKEGDEVAIIPPVSGG